MTIGRSGNSIPNNRQQFRKARKRASSRHVLLESLEGRQLMAAGPQLISIQPNEGETIRDGQILNISPNEIVFRFNDAASIDLASVQNGKGIQISRSGGDGVFDRAYVSNDLGTNGGVVLDFSSVVPGGSGNGIQISFTKAFRSDTRLPRLTVSGNSIQVEVNTNPSLRTTAQDLINGFRNSTPASSKVLVTRLRGSEFTVIADTVPVGQPLVLEGANTARATSNLNAGSNVQVEFLAATAGAAGLSSRLEVTSRDFGGAALPLVSTSGQTVRVQINSNAQFATNIGQFLDAINNHAGAANILKARLVSGSRSTAFGAFPITYSPITLTGITDTRVTPAYVGLGDSANTVIMRFAEALPDDSYRIDILGRGPLRLVDTSGQPYNMGSDTSLGFVLDLGVRIQAVVPQPIPLERQSNGSLKAPLLNAIHVYFDKGDLLPADVQNPRFYQLRYTNSNISTEDDQIIYPRLVRYNAEAARAELEFARNLDDLFTSAGGNGAFRLRIGSTEGSEGIQFGGGSGPGIGSLVPLPISRPTEVAIGVDPGSRFDTATDLTGQWTPATAGPSSVVVTSEIRNTTPFALDFPGADDEPGNRRIRYQRHVTRVDSDGIEVIEYNFQGILGTANGSVQLNAITEDQKQLVRRILSLYENYLGVRFVESASRGFTVAVGDLRAINQRAVNGPGFPFLETGPLLSNGQNATIVDIQDFNTADQNRFGTELFRTFARGIGNLLGLGTADEAPGLTVQSNNPVVNPGIDTEMVFPGNLDIVYGQHVHRPESTDIDLYRFDLPVAGRIKIEIAAERLTDSSLLDAVLRLYQREGSGWREIAINDDYFSQDSLIQLDLGAGEYIVGVTAKGNQTYDPNIEDSGLGGRSEGRYELRMDFRPPETSLMRETPKINQSAGTALDGDHDGRPGGLFDFWFVPSGPANTFYVDKAAPGTGSGNGSIATPFRTISAALAAANASPINNRVIRIVGNGGADGLMQTTSDNLAYEIGFNRLGQAQADGTTFDVPKNVTVVIDAGAIVKLSRARIGVGSTTISVDRSGGALQALGIPRFVDSATGRVITDLSGAPVPGSVYFTSLNDRIGVGTNRDTSPPAAAPGDWGGIDIRNRIDASLASSGRFDREAQGLFLNSIVHADVRFGGGQVIVDGVSQVITPIHMVDARPTIGSSTIVRSADAAMAATPNSFKESNFHDPATQQMGLIDAGTGNPRRFINDFERVGPDIHGNRLVNNSVNALFVKTRTGAASTTEGMTVAGRFDDLDVVHVIAENLVIQGSSGGVQAAVVPPVSTSVVLSPSTDSTVPNGMTQGTYRYRFAILENGEIGPASSPTTAVNLSGTQNQVLLTALPIVLPGQQLLIYRTSVSAFGFFGRGRFGGGGGEEYRLVGVVGPSQPSFLDRTAPPGSTLSFFFSNPLVTSPSLSSVFTPSAVPGLTTGLSAGQYTYQYRYVTSDGSESLSTQASGVIDVLTTPGVANGQVEITNLPVVDPTSLLRIYRSPVINGVATGYVLAGSVAAGTRVFTDVNLPVRVNPVTSPVPSSVIAAPVMASPSGTTTTFTPTNAGGSLPAARYLYRFAFAGVDGSESASAEVLAGGLPVQINVLPTHNQVVIANLPAIPSNLVLRVFRATVPALGQPVYELVGIVGPGSTSFVDQNATLVITPAVSPNTSLPAPPLSVVLTPGIHPTLTNAIAAGTYAYRFTFVSNQGESPAVPPRNGLANTTVQVTTTPGVADGQVELTNLPSIPDGHTLRIYRASVINGVASDFFQVASLTGQVASFLDLNAAPGPLLDDSILGQLKARTNGSLVVDPGAVLKLQGSRIEVQEGGQFLAEGTVQQPIIMTSINDVRYGAGGTYDTANRIHVTTGVNQSPAAPGNWGGLYVGQGSTGSLDHVRLAYAGGTTRIDGGFASFSAIEGHQARLRVAHSRLENNEDGVEDGAPTDRVGRGTNFTSSIYVRGSQPIIVGNTLNDNAGAAINIDVDSLNGSFQDDYGRFTGLVGRFASRPDNQGPLIESNRLSNNDTNGLLIRGQTMTTQGVWDDTDIVHVVRDEVIVANHYTYGGLRLESKPNQSLIVKFLSSDTNGLTASGRNLDIVDRIGGSIQIVGQPGYPVVLTSINDDTVGAGFQPNGLPMTDTNNDGSLDQSISVVLPTGPEVDNGTLIDNDVVQANPGYFGFQPAPGGGELASGITAQGRTQLAINQDVIFEFLNYVDVGSDGTAISLANTTITLQPTLISPDLVASEGNFLNEDGEQINWRVESSFANGVAQLVNTLTFSSDVPLGNLRFINYLDEDVGLPNDDLLFTTGTPGQADFRVFTVDGAERFGFSQGGVYLPGTGLQNATYTGWAANQFNLLQTDILGAGTQYTLVGNVNTALLPPINDPAIGSAFGPNDVTTAMAWDVDPTATTATITTFLELLPQEARSRVVPGEWRGLNFETESNDRNVGVVTEKESARSTAPAANDVTGRSQLLGILSSSPRSGDENARLGFQVEGTINRPSDQDIYSFYALGGTEVWFDIDRTANSLDAVVELIDANGGILALSDNSFDEEDDPSLLYRSSLPTSSVNPLRKSSTQIFPTDSRFQPRDLYSTNPKDAGMRVILPGPTNQTTLYHVRVRSSNATGLNDADRLARLTDSTLVGRGLSRGAYQMQVRLTENDEFPGSAVSFADVRYASTGIDLAGVPRHSPLLGETSEEEVQTGGANNDTFATAQNLGNILDTDRATISLAGTLSSATDVDWYRFTIDYNLLNTQLAEYFSTVFDIDYADGIGRPDTSIYLYNDAGNLLSFGLTSNILDDRAGVLRGADNSDLARGSAGTLDPFIGATELAAGEYFIAVTSQGMIPQSLLNYNAPDTGDPLLRAQPSNNSQWIVEDRVDQPGGSTSARSPIVPTFLPTSAAVPFTLGDVALYLNQDLGASSQIYIANPKTGTITNALGVTGEDIQDIAFRYNGDLRGFNSLGSATGGGDRDNLIDYHHIDDGTGTTTRVGESNIQTVQLDLASGNIEDANVGIEFNAITFANFGNEVGIAVGNRATVTQANLNGIHGTRPPGARGTNVIYRFDPDTGEAVVGGDLFNVVVADNQGPIPDVILGNGTDIQERGYIETNPPVGSVSRTLIFSEATEVNGLRSLNLINDGDFFSLVTTAPVPLNAVFEMNSGPQFNMNLNPDLGPYFIDGDRFVLDGQVFEIQTNSTAVAAGAIAVNYTTTDTNADFVAELRRVMPASFNILIGHDGTRINFIRTPGDSRPVVIDPIVGTSIGRVITLSGNGTVAPGRVAVNFLASDTDAEIATRAADAINALLLPGLSASANGNRVTIVGGNLTAANGGVRREGLAPGGTITGVAAFPDGRIFAVSDTGGLFGVNNAFAATETPAQVGVFITTATDLIGLNFTGLTAGPRNVEGGRYADLLFATTAAGEIVAFNTAGELQPVFAGGASRIATGIAGLNGLAFSNLDYNLWHQTPQRGLDDGHGRPATPDGIVQATTGDFSWYFGFEGPARNGVNLTGAADISAAGSPARFSGSTVVDTYNFPGGAIGILESEPISLADVAPTDSPYFYFNYFSTVENAASRDSFRVQAMGDNGVWQTVAHNDVVTQNRSIFNNDANQSSWRQARINLASFAGNREVRFRFEFSTGSGLGDSRGPELKTVPGSQLNDGATFTLGNQVFEIDFGASVVTPAGAFISNLSTLTVGSFPFIFYDGTGTAPLGRIIPIDRDSTAAQMAQTIADVINDALLPAVPPDTGIVNAIVEGTKIQITGGATVTGTGTFASNSILGSPGVGVGRIPVPLARSMTSDQVAEALQLVLDTSLAGGSQVFPRYGDILTLPGLTVTNAGPFSFSTAAPNNNLRSVNNDFEGIYLDDFVIGFAERGEIVSVQTNDTTFVRNPNRILNGINVGPYQLEIRGGEEYLTASRFGLDYQTGFEHNQRLSTGATMTLTGAENLVDGDFIDIGDGVQTLRFVFKDTRSNVPLGAGEIAVPFSTRVTDPVSGLVQAESASVIASRFRDLINSPSVQARLNVTAISINGMTSGLGGPSIALSSNAIVEPEEVFPREPIAEVDVEQLRGDENTFRDQGQIIIENSRIADSENFGIRLRADDRTQNSNSPNPGSTRNTVVINSERLAPGAVIMNNELTGNVLGGISIVGDTAAPGSSSATIPYARIINNTIIGGAVTQPSNIVPGIYNDYLFTLGIIAFADRVPAGGYLPNFSGGPVPIVGLDQSTDAIGNPNYTGDPLADPVAGQGAVSLGNGGRLVVEFTDNILTGSGDARPDLAIFEVGISERIAVEVSADGINYVSVGFVDGVSRSIDLDFYGFNSDSRLTFVRLTDVVTDGATAGDSVGADVDAVGALSSIPATIFQPRGVGIEVGPNASPTLLNNILVNHATGITIDTTSTSTVIGGATFHRNSVNVPNGASLGQFSRIIATSDEIFNDVFNRRLYPRSGAPIIDSSIDSLIDRAGLVSVKTPLGLQPSPILAPNFDINGLLRVDDPTVDTPAGLGENVFKDRGAQDRSDFVGPAPIVIDPTDNDTVPADVNPATGIVELNGTSQPYFDIRIDDGGDLGDATVGVGVDPLTVSGAGIVLTRDGIPLVEGVDYRFGFDATGGIIRLTPVGGVWTADSVYQVRFIKTGQSVIPLKSVANSNDTATYTIVDSSGGFTRFELDLGLILTVPRLPTGTAHALTDGGQFVLNQGIVPFLFEFDDNGSVSSNAIPISILQSDTPAMVVDKMRTAILTSGIFASSTALDTSRLQVFGEGITLTGLTANLTVTGRSGVLPGSIAVPLDASRVSDAADVAALFAQTVINTAIPGVTVTQMAANVLIEGAASVVGEAAEVVRGITDRAGNPLRSNQSDGSTVVTIQIGSGLDYGDAPDPVYLSLKSSDGPRHLVVDGFQLGSTNTADADARPDNGDVDDGVAFNQAIPQGFSSQVIVTAAGITVGRPGYLSAWIDFDGDGSFEANEQISNATNDTLVNGANTISFNVPSFARVGSTYARFRLSTARNLTATGQAEDGEVEDHLVQVLGNPYRNQQIAADVNGDGFVSAIDALQVINYLARNGSGQLVYPANQVVPPYIDVNGDGVASPIDVLQVINAINRGARGSGEGEAPAATTWVAASSLANHGFPAVEKAHTPSTDPVPVEPARAVEKQAVWEAVAQDPNGLATGWMEDDVIDSMAEAIQSQDRPASLHDQVFSGLDDISP